ncbi:hypothetical protein MHBO_001807 [Bonamia ostreae]|uniref:Uncharacterized protein n=1 Tax=Bonamia ostreae TaxID=126728 RepID=A0ABV2AK86_9EUKA
MPKKSAVANFVFRPKRYNLVTDKMAAKRISKMLLNPRIRHRYFAIDTETVGCDPTFQSPCKMAYMISASIYCGPDVNFGNGPYIWIENINEHLIKYFQPFFADPTIKKVSLHSFTINC